MTRWNLVIAHPPCTHLAVSGSRHFAAKRADGRQQDAINFVASLFWLLGRQADEWALENPVSIISSKFWKPSQIIQPYQFGHMERKATCLWLSRGLPLLRPTSDLKAQTMALPARQRDRIHHMAPGKDRAAKRSETYAGVADAMVKQWG